MSLKQSMLASVTAGIMATATLSPSSAADNGPDVSTDKVAAAPASMDDKGKAIEADKDMQAVLDSLATLKGKPIETLTAAEARKQPTPADAVAALLKKEGKNPDKLKADMKVTTRDVTYPAGKGTQPARIYTPDANDRFSKDALQPLIVYYHGGGFVLADLDTYDATPRALAKKTGAIVVSVDYRYAPENKFPAAHEDAYAAYQWVLQNAPSWGGDVNNIAVAGESAGGNLAANVAIKARDAKNTMPAHMLLVYPVAGTDMTTESYQKNADAKPLNKPMMEWFFKEASSSPADKTDPRLNLVAADLKGLPNATIITAQIDPLQSEGIKLADQIEAAGGKVDHKNYEGVTHEFFGMSGAVADADDAQDYAAGNLKNAFKDNQKTQN